METLSDVDKLRFYRDEIKHEFSLPAMRTTILVTCQSFLVVPYAVLNTAAEFKLVLVSIYAVHEKECTVTLKALEGNQANTVHS